MAPISKSTREQEIVWRQQAEAAESEAWELVRDLYDSLHTVLGGHAPADPEVAATLGLVRKKLAERG